MGGTFSNVANVANATDKNYECLYLNIDIKKEEHTIDFYSRYQDYDIYITFDKDILQPKNYVNCDNDANNAKDTSSSEAIVFLDNVLVSEINQKELIQICTKHTRPPNINNYLECFQEIRNRLIKSALDNQWIQLNN